MYYSTQLLNAVVENYALTEEWLTEAEKVGAPEVNPRLRANRLDVESLMAEYERTIFQAKDRENFKAVRLCMASM